MTYVEPGPTSSYAPCPPGQPILNTADVGQAWTPIGTTLVVVMIVVASRSGLAAVGRPLIHFSQTIPPRRSGIGSPIQRNTGVRHVCPVIQAQLNVAHCRPHPVPLSVSPDRQQSQ
jgi:hypothetical protein